MPHISRIAFINRLPDKIKNIKIIFGESSKNNTLVSYISDFRNVDIFSNKNILSKKEIQIRDADSDAQVFSETGNLFRFNADMRYYWQICFEFQGTSYRINKNNAMMNLNELDDQGTLDIIVRKVENKIRATMIVPSGQVYFYFENY